MSGDRVNRWSGIALNVLSLTALFSVLSGLRVSFSPFSIHPQPPLPDEGTQAHIFQLSIVALAPTILLFLATADWSRPSRAARPLVLAAVAVVLAFGTLYCVEHP